MKPRRLLIAAGCLVAAAGGAWAQSPAERQDPAVRAGGLGPQVRVLAHERGGEEDQRGLGSTVSAMAHARNSARAEARVTAQIVAEPAAKTKGRGRR